MNVNESFYNQIQLWYHDGHVINYRCLYNKGKRCDKKIKQVARAERKFQSYAKCSPCL